MNLRRLRFTTANVRTKRLTRLRRAGADILRTLKAGPQPAALYGTSVLGFPPKLLGKLRTSFHTAGFKHACSRSCTIDLALVSKYYDPTYQALSDPIMHWAASLWNRVLPYGTMLRTFSTAVHDVVKGDYNAIVGPASACVYCLLEIGWSIHNLCTWKSRKGFIFDINVCAPRTVLHFILLDIQEYLWESLSLRSQSLSEFKTTP